MAFNDLERKWIERAMEGFLKRRRPPPSIRPQLDIGYRIKGQSVELFSVRPRFRRPPERAEMPVAKATFVRTREVWKIFWMRADLKWHGYEPASAVGTIDKFLEVVERDQYGCFWG